MSDNSSKMFIAILDKFSADFDNDFLFKDTYSWIF